MASVNDLATLARYNKIIDRVLGTWEGYELYQDMKSACEKYAQDPSDENRHRIFEIRDEFYIYTGKVLDKIPKSNYPDGETRGQV